MAVLLEDVAVPTQDSERPAIVERIWPGLMCCAVYVILALAMYGFGSIGSSQMPGTHTIDSIEQVWWLAWAAHALPNIHSLFLAHGQNYPYGQNFGVNGSMLALGVIFTPITKVFGPVVTFNILLRLALATSAASMCFVLRRWTTWWPAAFVGGLIYGFSPYMLNFGAYLFLIFAPLPPLILLITHETFVRQKWRPGPTGIALGLLCALQFFIWVEVLAGTVLVALFAVAVILAVSRRTFARRWRYSVTAIAYAAGVVCVLLAYPVLFTFAGPQHINGSPQSPAVLNALRGDFLSPLVSRPIEWVDPVRITAQVFTAGNVLYLGLPLIVALVCFAVFLRRRREILFAGSMALFSFILSLGSPLQIDGLNTSIPLPYGILSHLPALSGLEPRRFALYTALFAAAMFALGIDELWNRLGTQPHMLSHALEGTRERGKILGVAALALLMLIALLPMVPSSAQATRPTNVPPLFSSAAVESIPRESVVLAYPYPDTNSSTYLASLVPIQSSLLDQAVTGMRFNLLGGYGWFPSPSGHGGTISPALLEPQSVQAVFDSTFLDLTPSPRVLLPKAELTKDLKTFLRRFNVGTVLVPQPSTALTPEEKSLVRPAVIVSYVSTAIGPPESIGGVAAWFNVQERLRAAH
jgi:hypothetical protein